MLDPRNLLEVLAWEPGGRLYTDAEGRRIVLDVEDHNSSWGGPVVRVESVADALVLAAEGDGPVAAWALSGPEPSLLAGVSAKESAQGPCWLTDVRGLTSIDGQALDSWELPLVPVWQSARFESAVHHPTGQTLTLVQSIHMDQPGRYGWTVKSASRLTSDGHLAHLGPASWDVSVTLGSGVLLSKVYDRFHGLQRARVLVDGEPVGIWQAMRGDRTDRLAEAWFGLPPGHPEHFRLTIDPLPGTPLWDVAEYRAWELRGPGQG